MKFQISTASILEFGQRTDAMGRPHQEDSIFPAPGALSPADRLFIVCDGMGGHDAGEVASATVCEAISQYVLSHSSVDGVFPTSVLRDAITAAYDALDAHDTGALKKMGTTMTFLKLHAAGATIAHIGDSRVYHIRPGRDGASTRIMHVTGDHSLVAQLVRAGEMTPEEARVSPQKNIITRAMQPGLNPRPNADVYTTTDILPGDIFYLCTDGMIENMTDSDICLCFAQSTGDLRTIAETLVGITANNQDNHSALLVRITDVEGQPAEMPVEPAVTEPTAPARPQRPVATPSPAQPQKPVITAVAPEAARKSSSPLGWIIGGVVAVLIIAATTFFLMRSGSKDKEEQEDKPMVEAVGEGFEEVYEEFEEIEENSSAVSPTDKPSYNKPTGPTKIEDSQAAESQANVSSLSHLFESINNVNSADDDLKPQASDPED